MARPDVQHPCDILMTMPSANTHNPPSPSIQATAAPAIHARQSLLLGAQCGAGPMCVEETLTTLDAAAAAAANTSGVWPFATLQPASDVWLATWHSVEPVRDRLTPPLALTSAPLDVRALHGKRQHGGATASERGGGRGSAALTYFSRDAAPHLLTRAIPPPPPRQPRCRALLPPFFTRTAVPSRPGWPSTSSHLRPCSPACASSGCPSTRPTVPCSRLACWSCRPLSSSSGGARRTRPLASGGWPTSQRRWWLCCSAPTASVTCSRPLFLTLPLSRQLPRLSGAPGWKSSR